MEQYPYGHAYPYGHIMGAFGQHGGMLGNIGQQALYAQMQGMERNYLYLSDEEFDLIVKLRDKKSGIERAQKIEKEIWNPILEEKK